MSKLDDAFLKAYAKVRGGSVRHESRAAVEPIAEPIEGEVWVDADGQRHFRADDGVVNVASFIARTSNGRTRGTAIRPGDESHPSDGPWDPRVPQSHAVPAMAGERTFLVDEVHDLRAPHFQPIALNLAAFDLLAPQESAATLHAGLSESNVRSQMQTAADHKASEMSTASFAAPATIAEVARQRTVSGVRLGRTRGTGRGASNSDAFFRTDDSHPENRFSERNDQPAVSSIVEDTVNDTVNDIVEESVNGTVEETVNHIVVQGTVDDVVHEKPVSVAAPEPLVLADLSEFDAVLATADVSEVAASPEADIAESRAPFQAAWEVDRFEFEDIVWDLSSETSPLWMAAEQLQSACSEGLRVLAITSPGREQGRSTLAITISRMLAATGLSVVLLDGDIDRPALADKLSLEIRLGWGDAVRTGISAEEVAVHSVEDGFTVLPLAAPDSAKGMRPSAAATTKMLAQLSSAFDLIVIDTANVNVVGGWMPGADAPCMIDAALVIQDLRQEDADAMQACLRRLNKIGIENVGLVENFSGE